MKAHKAGADIRLALLYYYNTTMHRGSWLIPCPASIQQVHQNHHASIPEDVKDKKVKKVKLQVYYNQVTKKLDTLHCGDTVRI